MPKGIGIWGRTVGAFSCILAVLSCTACSAENDDAEVRATTQQVVAQTVKFALSVPTQTSISNFALDATGSLSVGDRATVELSTGGFAPIADVGATTAATTVGVTAKTGSITSLPSITVRDRAQISGDLTSGGSITLGNTVTVSGVQQRNATVQVDRYSWTVNFPASSVPVSVPNNGNSSVAPGVYSTVHAFSGSTLSLRTGTYYIDDLTIEPQAHLALNTTSGPILIYVRQTFTFRGQSAFTGPNDALLVGYAGTAAPALDATFNGTLVAPYAPVRLGIGGSPYTGAIFSADLSLDPDVRFVRRGFSGWTSLSFDPTPIFSCVEKRVDNSYAAVLGYFNPNVGPVSVPVGTANSFSGTQDRGQPATFLAGRFPTEFSVDFGTSTSLTWQLNGFSLPIPRTGTACQTSLTQSLAQDTTVSAASAHANFGTSSTLTVAEGSEALVQFDRALVKKALGAGRFVTKAMLIVTPVSGTQPSIDALALQHRWTENGATWTCANDTDTSTDGQACASLDTWNLVRDDASHQNPWLLHQAARRVTGAYAGGKLQFDVTRDVWNLIGNDGLIHPSGWALVKQVGAPGSVVLSSRESSSPPQLVLTLATRPQTNPPLSVSIDTSITPAKPTAKPLPDGVTRPVAGVRDPSGIQSDFVERELIFDVQSVSELTPVLSRWNATTVRVITPPSRAPSFWTSVVVRIDPSRVQAGTLVSRLLQIDNRPFGAHKISSQTGMATLSAAAEEALAGRRVSLNWLMKSDSPSVEDWSTRAIADGPYLSASSPQFGPNPFDWPGFSSCDPDPGDPQIPQRCRTTFPTQGNPPTAPGIFQHLTVADGWRALALSGRLIPASVPVGIVDEGLAPTHPDYPATHITADADMTLQSASVGHGTKALLTGFARAGNGFGAAGPGGPVANVTMESTGTTYDEQRNGFGSLFDTGPRIMSASRHATIPAIATLFTDADYQQYRSQGTLIFAAAGNEGKDVDDETCFIACWETTHYTPCEDDGVDCVTGMAFNSTSKDPGSNWGSDTTTISGPYWSEVSNIPLATVNGVLQPQPRGDGTFDPSFSVGFNGTSAATPFVAGITSVLMAADPSQSGDRVEHCLFEPIRTPVDVPFNTRAPDTLASVRCVMTGSSVGDLPTFVKITQPADGATVSLGQLVNVQATATDFELGQLTVSWSSDLDGNLTTSGSGQISTVQFKTPGVQHLTASAVGSDGKIVTNSITVNIGSIPGDFFITTPSQDGLQFAGGIEVTFQEGITGIIQPPCDTVTWRSTASNGSVDFDGLKGCTVQAVVLGAGSHSVQASTNDPVSGVPVSATRQYDIITITDFFVAIVSPPHAGDVFGVFGQAVPLEAQQLNGTNVAYHWSVNANGATFNIPGTSQTATFNPSDYFTESCVSLPVKINLTATNAANGAQSSDSNTILINPSPEFITANCVQ